MIFVSKAEKLEAGQFYQVCTCQVVTVTRFCSINSIMISRFRVGLGEVVC